MSAEDSPSHAKVGESQVGQALRSLKRFQLLKKNCPNLDSSDSSTSSKESIKESSRHNPIDYDPAEATASFLLIATRRWHTIRKVSLRLTMMKKAFEDLVSCSRFLQIKKHG